PALPPDTVTAPGTVTTPGTVHVVGAGLAGLAAAVALADAGRPVRLYDAAPRAGGRCRSFDDSALGARIDNGNHLMMAANTAVADFLDRVGAPDGLYKAPHARFDFLDLASGTRWSVHPNRGALAWWLLVPGRRVAGAGLWAHLRAAGLLLAGARDRVVDRVPAQGALYDRFILPLTEAVMNCGPDRASARLLRRVMVETFARGGDACRPWIAREGLSEALVDPALAHLDRHGVSLETGARLSAVERRDGRASALVFGRDRGRVALDAGDAVVLALPPDQTGKLLDLDVPQGAVPIVNVHFRLDVPLAPPGEPRLLGLVGGTAHWLFLRDRLASVTVSNATDLAQRPNDEIAQTCWADVSRALDRPAEPMPPVRVIIEKRATFLQTPENVARRPHSRTELANLALAGDWTDTGLPATIEGAIRSGFTAAEALSPAAPADTGTAPAQAIRAA
ncbi:hydroxysqualene dehydroxylase HpnE, partial [Rhodothalassium salexigens]